MSLKPTLDGSRFRPLTRSMDERIPTNLGSGSAFSLDPVASWFPADQYQQGRGLSPASLTNLQDGRAGLPAGFDVQSLIDWLLNKHQNGGFKNQAQNGPANSGMGQSGSNGGCAGCRQMSAGSENFQNVRSLGRQNDWASPGGQKTSALETSGKSDPSNFSTASTDPTLSSRQASVTPGVKGLLDTIAHAEGTSDAKAQKHGFRSGYDATLGYGAYTPGRFRNRRLTDMSLSEVKALQRGMLQNPRNRFNSSAVGRYQIVGKTLRRLQKQLGLPDSTKFTPAVQDRMAKALLDGRGLQAFQAGKMSAVRFQNNLSKEWASLPTTRTGRSFYGQRTGLTSRRLRTVIAGLRTDPSTLLAERPRRRFAVG